MIQLTDATVLVNNEAIGIMPNSLAFNEGLGEQKVRSVSIGNGKTETVYSRDLETNLGMVKFELPVTPQTIELLRAWKSNANQNVVQIAGSTPEGDVTRTFSSAALVTDYEVGVGSETTIEAEFRGNAPI
jgi:hypothetical protein